MADTGFVIAGAGANVDTGGVAFSNPGNITADDGGNTAALVGGSFSDDLKASTFGLSIPANNVIVGIEIRAQLLNGGGGQDVQWDRVVVGKADGSLGTPKDPGVTITSSAVDYDQGGATDLWGLTWTIAEVEAATFQVRVAGSSGSGGTQAFGCDAVWVKVYYAPASLAAGAGSFALTGIAANLQQGAAIAMNAGAFILSGVAATFRGGSALLAEAGSFIVSAVVEAVLTALQRVAMTVKTTYDVRPFLRKFRRSAPRLEE